MKNLVKAIVQYIKAYRSWKQIIKDSKGEK